MYGFNVCVCIFTICTVRGYTCVYGHIEKKKRKEDIACHAIPMVDNGFM